MNFLIEDLLMQYFYIQNRKMCLSKKILYQYFHQISFLNGGHTILQLTTVLLEKICNQPSGKVEWSSVISCVNINIRWGLYPQAEPLDYRLNICVTVCLWIARFESICFSLTPENFKNCKVFQVFKGVDERKISPNWVPGLGKKGLLNVCFNQLGWRREEGVNLYLFLTFW